MTKSKVHYICGSCGASHLRWAGRCSTCQEWNTLEEVVIRDASVFRTSAGPGHSEKPTVVDSVHFVTNNLNASIFPTGLIEFDRALGGGITPGSVTLVGGEPGIGKSTLLSQLLSNVALSGVPVLYVSAEESDNQVASRIHRVSGKEVSVGILTANNVLDIEGQVRNYKPAVVVIDSIQTIADPELASSPGSVVQVRECAARLIELAKASDIALVLVGHVTKDGSLAGPRVLEHLVDTVAYFEGDRDSSLRVLRVIKHRFGPVGDLGMFEMGESGLEDLIDATALHLVDRVSGQSGSVVFPAMDGRRVLLCEIQALVVSTSAEQPRRVVTGIDFNRFLLLLAVLEKKAGIKLHNKDVFVSIAGGVKITDPSADLAVLLAIVSSLKDSPVDPTLVCIGEIGLGGEIRLAAGEKQRLQEAVRMGFTRAVVGAKSGSEVDGQQIIKASGLSSALVAASLHFE